MGSKTRTCYSTGGHCKRRSKKFNCPGDCRPCVDESEWREHQQELRRERARKRKMGGTLIGQVIITALVIGVIGMAYYIACNTDRIHALEQWKVKETNITTQVASGLRKHDKAIGQHGANWTDLWAQIARVRQQAKDNNSTKETE